MIFVILVGIGLIWIASKLFKEGLLWLVSGILGAGVSRIRDRDL